MRYGMMIELDKCVGCQACVAACKERWDTGPKAARDWVFEYESGKRGKDLSLTFFPGLCNHCDGHPCTTDCPTGATFMNEQGIVVVDSDVCIGCGNCVSMCPYSARKVDEEKRIVEKCSYCEPYVKAGKQPACVETCLADCRHFGDLDDPKGDLTQLIKTRDAKPLTKPEHPNVGPRTYYAPADKRQTVLEQPGVIRKLEQSLLTKAWKNVTGPAARWAVPPMALLTGLGGLMINLRQRRMGKEQAPTTETQSDHHNGAHADDEKLFRHTRGMRVLHWFNAFSWLFLLLTGTALMVGSSFALFGPDVAKAIADFFGGAANLLKLHVVWGLLWAAIIVPFFLVFKHGGIEAIKEVLLTKDDIRWMMLKPLVMLGLTKKPLPPQDKYNAGQKMFAISALAGTTTIIATGLVMTFHIGPPELVSSAILLHKLAIMLALVGVAVHITMAAIIVEERPALKSMITGYVDRHHAESHATKWVDELEQQKHEKHGKSDE
jgi:formate dehydrogenase gamma subunit